jgi:hypothetical protein
MTDTRFWKPSDDPVTYRWLYPWRERPFALEVACEHCRERPGQKCRFPTHNRLPQGAVTRTPHQDRIELARQVFNLTEWCPECVYGPHNGAADDWEEGLDPYRSVVYSPDAWKDPDFDPERQLVHELLGAPGGYKFAACPLCGTSAGIECLSHVSVEAASAYRLGGLKPACELTLSLRASEKINTTTV